MEFQLWPVSGDRFVILQDGVVIASPMSDADLATLEGVLRQRPGEVVDMGWALALAEAMGQAVERDTLRRALNRGNIVGAYKKSVSGRAKTNRGGQWRLPRAAFLAWLEGRKAEGNDERTNGVD